MKQFWVHFWIRIKKKKKKKKKIRSERGGGCDGGSREADKDSCRS